MSETAYTRRHDGSAGGGESAAPGGARGPRVVGRLRRLGGGLVVAAVVVLAAGLVILTVGPRLLPYRTYTIVGGSMSPTIARGAQIVLRPVDGERLRAGDVITFQRPGPTGEIVTHRVVRVETRAGRRLLVTKGDGNAIADAWRIPAEGTGWRYAFQIPRAGYAVAFLALPIVRFLLVCLLAFAFAAAIFRRIWSPAEQPA